MSKNTIEELESIIQSMKDDSGREGCTYGDTEYDSLSAVYGYNLAIDNISEKLQSLKVSPPEGVKTKEEILDALCKNYFGHTFDFFKKELRDVILQAMQEYIDQLPLPTVVTEREICIHCNGSFAVKIGEQEYSECPCVNLKQTGVSEHEIERMAEHSSEVQEGTYTTQHKITYKHGYIEGIKQGLQMQKQEEWISVEERKPDFDKLVLVFCKIYGVFTAEYRFIGDFNGEAFGNWHDGVQLGILPPTHWQPLPKEPKRLCKDCDKNAPMKGTNKCQWCALSDM